ncbi:hypothetical protein F01_320028 [Burkholderia cenocepacia]|nr:hypothetical protein F01_320028 [Burkholderia cenocepacia]
MPDLWLDLRRRSRAAGRGRRPGHALGRRPDQLDVSRMRRPQGRLRDGPDLTGPLAHGHSAQASHRPGACAPRFARAT